MQREPKTVYQAARWTTGFTQEQAAELLHISIESLRAYERGATVPPSDMVVAMIRIYGTPWLAYEHLKLNDPVGRELLPDFELRDLASSVLLLQKEMADIQLVRDDMIAVAVDGQVDKQESSRWTQVKSEVMQLISGCFSVVYAKEKTARMRAVK